MNNKNKLDVAGLSDIGLAREKNEDALLIMPEKGMFIVSDGIGGRHAGQLAAQAVVNILPKLLEKNLKNTLETKLETIEIILRKTVIELSQMLWKHSRGKVGIAGMGATLVLAYIKDGYVYIASMGDSRAYLYRNNHLTLLTEDHTVARLLFCSGEITYDQIKSHPARATLSRYVGMENLAYPDIRKEKLCVGDKLLLCTDGLNKGVSDQTLSLILSSHHNPKEICRSLIGLANDAGGNDNTTIIVLNYK